MLSVVHSVCLRSEAVCVGAKEKQSHSSALYMCIFLRWNLEHQIESCSCLLLDACLRCQAENKQEDCVVVWGECNHSFHNCCMSLWVKQNNRCPLCQQDWVVQRIGK
uniref:cullin-RING-type E3 NEDD8 transferase n=1 Tax=Meleagris gallopavo TaxID=9103 RepID=A0A803XU08_MELGA